MSLNDLSSNDFELITIHLPQQIEYLDLSTNYIDDSNWTLLRELLSRQQLKVLILAGNPIIGEMHIHHFEIIHDASFLMKLIWISESLVDISLSWKSRLGKFAYSKELVDLIQKQHKNFYQSMSRNLLLF